MLRKMLLIVVALVALSALVVGRAVATTPAGVTAETARRIAETYLAQHPDLGATGVREVQRCNERPGGFPGIYWARWSLPAPDELAPHRFVD